MVSEEGLINVFGAPNSNHPNPFSEIIFVQILLGPLLSLVIIQDKTCDPSKEFRLNEQGKTRYIENDGRYFGLLLCLFATYAVTMGAILGRVNAAALLAGCGPHQSLFIRSITLQICSSIAIGAAEVVAKRSSSMEKVRKAGAEY